MTLDELLLEWSYRSERGYPSLDNPSDIFILNQILKELNLPSNEIIEVLKEAGKDNTEKPGTDGMEKSPVFDKPNPPSKDDSRTSIEKDFEKFDDEADKRDIDPCTATEQELLSIFRDMVASGDIDPNDQKQMRLLVNRTCAFRLEPTLRTHLTKKGFSSLIFKEYAKQIRDLTEKESTEDRKKFNDYLKNESAQISLPEKTRGNLTDEMKKSGLPSSILNKLIIHTAQDEGKKGVGMGELALAIVFKDITDSVGKGDLALEGEYFEVKAQAATLGKKPEDFKASLETVKEFERFGLKREPVKNPKSGKTTTKLTFGNKAYALNEFTTALSLAYRATNEKEGLKDLVQRMISNDAKHSSAAVEYGMKDMDLNDPQSIQSSIAKIHFYNYVEGEGFTHFLAHDMGQKSKKGVVQFIGVGEYIYVKGTPGEMADALIEAGATFERVTFNNMRPRIGFGASFAE